MVPPGRCPYTGGLSAQVFQRLAFSPGNLEGSVRSALEGSMPGAVADLIEAGLNEGAGLLGAMGIEAWALA